MINNDSSFPSPAVGRFAPSPTGRMHLGNLFTALLSWLSVRKSGEKWILRIEDLDPQRSRPEYARQIEDDLCWLGLDWDEGGLEDKGTSGPYRQSLRGENYEAYLRKLQSTGYTYPCFCSRADIMATQAPHQSDGRIIYGGRCRPAALPCFETPRRDNERPPAVRLYVPDRQRAWAYQLAVVVDDALMGVTEVVRGNDLLLSAAQQIYLYGLLGVKAPHYAHLPLLGNRAGQRLSKRDSAMSMEELRKTFRPEELVGHLARIAGLVSEETACAPQELVGLFEWNRIRPVQMITV